MPTRTKSSSDDEDFELLKTQALVVTCGPHSPWIDEFEIRVGDSIVQKITEGTSTAGYLVLFLSSASTSSDWVKREWSSSLARQLSGRDIKVLPALIEDCEIPAILSDIKYADFRNSYNDGLSELLISLA